MNHLKSLKIKNYKHIGDSYVGFEKIDNFNILVGQNNIGKSTLLQSIEILISGNDSNRYITENTKVRFSFVQKKMIYILCLETICMGVILVVIIGILGKNMSISVCLMTLSPGKL